MTVDVEVQGRAEALEARYGPRPTIGNAEVAAAPSLPGSMGTICPPKGEVPVRVWTKILAAEVTLIEGLRKKSKSLVPPMTE